MSKFKHIVKITVFALGIAIFGLAPAAQARSDRDNHRNHNRYDNYDNKRYNTHRRNYRNNRYNYGYNNYGYRDNSYSYNYNSLHRRHGNDVVLGVLAGGLLFYALTAKQRNADTVYVQQQPVYAQPQQQWTQQRQPVTQPQNRDSSCLQVREYQTTITVGGQAVPAYGQSCLQADGSWKLGPAIAEPNY